MSIDAKFYREMAQWWRDFAALCDERLRAERLRFADELDAMAERRESQYGEL